ncbi:D-alanyl-D-alanine carboxypeptidase DacF [bioreactor metagenome]|uniref:D-alanyl-D-alanine carboxypeptidase DacF n=1 Tax=bioreactor metagenome TaxID=1076179 RepID=A0A645AU21_9ZZZZ
MNATGLDAEGHYTSANDIAVMSRELIKHDMIYKYTTIWIDYLRDGKFMLANTNRLVRFYEGATGLKTGSTSIAKYCLSATAKRNDMELIAVILAADTSDKRFNDARSLLDFGFANFGIWTDEENLPQDQIAVLKGKLPGVMIKPETGFHMIVKKGDEKLIEKEVVLPENINAPVEKGQLIGHINYTLNGQEIGKVEIKAVQNVERTNYFFSFGRLLSDFFMMNR